MIADQRAQRCGEFFGDPAGHAACRDPTRLRVADQAELAATDLQANFRHIPAPRTPEDEMASEPWYSIGPLDVFPEEFPPFLFADAGQRKLFDQLHGELYNADYWKGLQEAIRAGKVIDVFPYRRKERDNE